MVTAIAAGARQVSPDEAAVIASDFLNSSSVQRAQGRVTVQRAKPANHQTEAPFYVFNADENHGFVIVSGDDRARKILGYFDTGYFDVDNIPPHLKNFLSQYATIISSIPYNIGTDRSWKNENVTAGKPSETILKTALWDQGYPYNIMCPTIEGYKTPTGCTATAMGIIMKYHQWPLNAKGQNSYEWNGQIISSDYSNSKYEWSKIFDEYNSEKEYPNDIEGAIGNLMWDCSTSISSNFQIGETLASETHASTALVDNFNYQPIIHSLSSTYAPIDYFFEKIINEIDQDRPVMFVSLKTPIGTNPHAFVADGYDNNGNVHFNWGWGGQYNGFYSIDPVSGIFGMELSFMYGIVPTNLPTPEYDNEPLAGAYQFMYNTDGKIHCVYGIRAYYTPTLPSIDCGFIIRNTISGNETFYSLGKMAVEKWVRGGNWIQELDEKINLILDDGDYTLLPAYQVEGCGAEKCLTNELQHSKIRLNVSNGIYKFENERPYEFPIKLGTTEIDNIFYILDYEQNQATVTYRNSSFNSYEGDIIIPEQISFNNNIFTVTTIGQSAFRDCGNLGNIQLPNTIHTIEETSFWNVKYKSINLHELTHVERLDNAFLIKYNEDDFQLPTNITTLGRCVVWGAKSNLLEIPESVTEIGPEAFAYNPKIDAIKFTRKDLANFTIAPSAITTDTYYNPYTIPAIFIPIEEESHYMEFPAFDRCDIIKPYCDDIVQASKLKVIYEGRELSPNEDIFLDNNEVLDLKIEIEPENTDIQNIRWEKGDGWTYYVPYENDQYHYFPWHGDDTDNLGYDEILVAITRDGSHLNFPIHIHKYGLTQEIKISSNKEFLKVGESIQLAIDIFPINTNKNINWTSTDNHIAIVDETGLVEGLCPGETTIIAKATDGSEVSASLKITVVPVLAESLTLSPEIWTGEKGCTFSISATVLPDNTTDKSISWQTSDESIATVDANGTVTALAVGEAVITATASDGSGVSASCFVTVTQPELGDSNANGSVNIADAVNTANYAVGNPVEKFCFEAADVNGDQRITLSDASGTVTIVLNQPVDYAMSPMRQGHPAASEQNIFDTLIIDDFSAMAEQRSTVDVTLDNSIEYVALQADIATSKGATLEDVRIGDRAKDTHSLSTRRIDERTMRVALFDLENRLFGSSDSPILQLIVKVDDVNAGDIIATNILAADSNAHEHWLAYAGGHNYGTTGIEGVNPDAVRVTASADGISIVNAEGYDIAIYSLTGQTVAHFTAHTEIECVKLATGCYIVKVGNSVSKVFVK